MESDHMRQLLHLTKGIWENKNPLISSILVYGCYKSALFLGWTPNTGLFLYSILQIIILALAVSYGTFIMAREGYGKRYLLPLCLFNAAVPYNVFYSYGMWKDTLFAILMLLTVLESVDLYLLSKNNIPFSGIRYFILAITALCCGLSRNSGMFSILIMIPSLLLMLHTDKLKYRMAGALLTGLIISILISGPVFRELGIELSTDTVYASSVPLQQIGRIITEEKEISEEERKMLEAVIDLQTVRDSYDPVCADPMKDAVSDSSSYLAEHRLEYLKLWFELGKKHPLTYYRAYRDLMRMYYDPNVSSEVSYRWIYENSLGIYRDPKLLPKADFAYYEQILELPAVNLLQRPGALLWGLLILASILINRRLKERIAFLIPFLGIYLGLFLTAPVALFRYVYACFLAAPFLLMIAFLPSDRNLKEDLKEWDREL